MLARPILAMSLVTLASSALGCESPPEPRDASSAIDAGAEDAPLDAPRPDAPRVDAGFDPASLAACELDTSHAFDPAIHRDFVAPAATAFARREAMAFALLAEQGSVDALEPFTSEARAALAEASACGGEAACVRAALLVSESDASAVAAAIVSHVDLAAYVPRLRASGVCILFDEGDDAAFVTRCVADQLAQLSSVLDARVVGELDATALDAVIDDVTDEASTLPLWGPLLEVDRRGLLAAGRDEAVRYEPLDDENAAALARLATIDWSAYPFVAIVVPGQGPTDADTALNPIGAGRCDLAYERLAAGLAPVILLTGGHVHPDRTRFSEAIEMRRYLVQERGVDPASVMVDPYARHTTTNLRNAARILVRAGAPTDRPVLVTSDLLQSAYIASMALVNRSVDELGYAPYEQLTRLSDEDACLLFDERAFHVDARDELDP